MTRVARRRDVLDELAGAAARVRAMETGAIAYTRSPATGITEDEWTVLSLEAGWSVYQQLRVRIVSDLVALQGSPMRTTTDADDELVAELDDRHLPSHEVRADVVTRLGDPAQVRVTPSGEIRATAPHGSALGVHIALSWERRR